MSFKHFFNESTIQKLNESKWWSKFDETKTSIVEYVSESGCKRSMKACKVDESTDGLAYILETRKGIRYGLYRATEGKFHLVRFKKGVKAFKKPKGVFKEVDGKLMYEMASTPTISQVDIQHEQN